MNAIPVPWSGGTKSTRRSDWFDFSAFESEVTLAADSWSRHVTSVSSAAAPIVRYAGQTAVSGFDHAPNDQAELEWRRLYRQSVVDPAYEPARTPLGAVLRALRARIIESGEKMLSLEEIQLELAERRGDAERRDT